MPEGQMFPTRADVDMSQPASSVLVGFDPNISYLKILKVFVVVSRRPL